MPYCETCRDETAPHAFLANTCRDCGRPYRSTRAQATNTRQDAPVSASVGPLGHVLAASLASPQSPGAALSEDRPAQTNAPVFDADSWGAALAARLTTVLQTRDFQGRSDEQAKNLRTKLQTIASAFTAEQRTKIQDVVSDWEALPLLTSRTTTQPTTTQPTTTQPTTTRQTTAQLTVGQATPTLRAINEEVQQAMQQLEAANGAPMATKLQRAQKATQIVNSVESLAELPVHHQIKLLGSLQLAKDSQGELPEPQRAAIVKMYGAIHLDKNFRVDDKQRREQVLAAVTNQHVIADAQANWSTLPGLADSNPKKDALRKAHELQCAALGLAYNPANVVFQSMREGSSGFAKDKVVRISTNPSSSKDFNEVLDTIIHETTHAYQRFLVEELDERRLTVDDPRYAQACLFKLNDGTYIHPPPKELKQTDRAKYDAEYLAYKRQPVEEHAWKAGGEASRAFDAKAAAVDLAAVVADLARILPDKKEEAMAILEKSRAAKDDVRGAAASLVKVDALAEGAFEAIKKSTLELIRKLAETSGQRALDTALTEYNAIVTNDDKFSHRERFRKMRALAGKLESRTGQGQSALGAFDDAHRRVHELLAKIQQLSGAEAYNRHNQPRYNAENFRGDVQIRLEMMLACEEALKKDIAATELAIAQSQAQTSEQKVQREELAEAKKRVDELIRSIDERVFTEFKDLFPGGRTGASKKVLDIERNTKKGLVDRAEELTNLGTDLKSKLEDATTLLKEFDEVVGKMKPQPADRVAVNNIKANANLSIADRIVQLKQHRAYSK